MQYSIAGNQLWLSKHQATYIDAVRRLVDQHVAADDGLFIAPHSPGLYPILQRESPVYNSYMLFPETKVKQEKIIQNLIKHKVNWAILTDIALDGRDELRFRHTHSLVWEYLMINFEPMETPNLPSNEQFLRRKNIL